MKKEKRDNICSSKAVWMMCCMALALYSMAAGCGAKEDASDSIVCYVGHGFWDGSLDPVKGGFAYGYDFVNNSLVRVNAQSEYEGDLAESWEISEDALTYTYRLKQGIHFQDGSDFTAEDVVFTYETVMANQGQNEKVDLSKVEQVEALDDYTVKFTLIFLTSMVSNFSICIPFMVSSL